jgi:hypothetical protein
MKKREDGARKRSGGKSGRRLSLASERGVALAMVLILSAMALAIMAALVYMLTAGTQVSGVQKRYRTALEAGKGGAEIAYGLIAARGNPNIPGLTMTIPAMTRAGAQGPCLIQKLNQKTSTWDPECTNVNELVIDPDTSDTYDWSFNLGSAADAAYGSSVYTVYAKIADTVEGNSGGDVGLSKGGVVASNSGELPVMSRPYLYTLEVDVQSSTDRQERAKYSILYQY